MIKEEQILGKQCERVQNMRIYKITDDSIEMN
jgi:hypothetical protein